jgi:hypothetical protein
VSDKIRKGIKDVYIEMRYRMTIAESMNERF